jgi:hypothetical protein
MVSVSFLARFESSLTRFFCFEFLVWACWSFCALGWRNMAAIIYNLFVINKSGGLIFYKVVCLQTIDFIYHTLPFLLLLRW